MVLFLVFSTAPDSIALLSSKHHPTDISHSSDIWPVTVAEMRAEEILTFSTTSPSPTYLTTAPWVKTKWSDSGSKWQFSDKEKSQGTKQGMKKGKRLMHWLNSRSPWRLAFTTAYYCFEPLVGADSVRTLTVKKGRGRDCDGNSQWNNQHMFYAPSHGARKQREQSFSSHGAGEHGGNGVEERSLLAFSLSGLSILWIVSCISAV